jgi:signal transduction histidine kinase
MKKHILLLVLILLNSACGHKKENFYFEKVTPPKEDSTKVWLRQNDNYKADKEYYLKVFFKYYNTKLANKEYLNASKILDVITTKFVYFYDFDSRLTKTVDEFNLKYRNKLPALKTTHIDNYYANLEFDKDNVKKAKDYFLKITALEPDDYKSCYKIARAYYDLSYAYFILGDIELSIEANEKSRIYSERIRDKESIVSVHLNYINIYKANGSFEKAIHSANEAIKVFKEEGNTYDYFMGKYNKCSIYGFFSKTQLKNNYTHTTYKEYLDSKFDSDVLLLCLSDYEIAALLDENKIKEAKIVLDRIKPVAAKNTSQNWQNDYQAALALFEIKNDVKNCNTSYIEKALPNLLENKNYERANLFYNVLLEKAIQNKEYEKAVFYTQETYRTKDSLSNIQNKLENLALAAKYETKEKEQKIQLQHEVISKKNTTIISLLLVFIASLLGVFIYFLKQKQMKLFKEKEQSQQFTKNLLDKTEEERKRIASDLHDSVSHELLALKNSFEANHFQLNEKVDTIINDIRAISRNLHPVMFEKIGLVNSLEQFIERIENTHQFMISSEFNYQNSLTSEKELQVYRIVQEAVTNIIKYADAIAAKITIIETSEKISVEVIDNGIGFNVEETLQSKDAFGLHNIIERSKAIGGIATISSSEKGTKIVIEIKK